MRNFILIIVFLFSTVTFAQFTPQQKAMVTFGNLLLNPGAENGKANITASGGTFTTTTTAANVGSGKTAFSWNSNSASQTLTWSSVTVPYGLANKNGIAACNIQTPSGSATHTLQAYDGTNILASVTVTSSTTYARTILNFPFGAAASTVALRLVSVASDEPIIYIDDCILGDATLINLSQISQAQFIGSAHHTVAQDCIATKSVSVSAYGSFHGTYNGSTCTAPAIELNPGPGTISTSDDDTLDFTVNNLPAGTYKIHYSVSLSLDENNRHLFATISDGTTNSGHCDGAETTASGTLVQCNMEGVFTYTSAGNRTFEIKVSGTTASKNAILIGDNYTTMSNIYSNHFTIFRYPTAGELAYRPEVLANSWSGYHDSTCSWARTNTAFGDPAADSTCTFTERANNNFGTVSSYLSGSDKLPGIVFTPTSVGTYYICALTTFYGPASAVATLGVRLIDIGASLELANQGQQTETTAQSLLNQNICAIYNATSVASKTIALQTRSSTGAITMMNSVSGYNAVEWSIIKISTSLPNPILLGGVNVPQNPTGTTTINNYVSKSSTYTATASDETIAYTASATLNLPAAATVTGKKYHAVPNGVGVIITIDPNASETIDGSTTKTFSFATTIQSTGSAWISIGGSGGGAGGGIQIKWLRSGGNSPLDDVYTSSEIFSFDAALAQELYTSFKVPTAYVAGSPIKLKLVYSSPDTSGTVLFTSVSTLLATNTTAFTSTTNQRTSTNSAATLSGTANRINEVILDLTNTDGTINSVAVAPGDVINIKLTRGTDTATSAVRLHSNIYEVTLQ